MILFNLSFNSSLLHLSSKNNLYNRLYVTKAVYMYRVRKNSNLNSLKGNTFLCSTSLDYSLLMSQSSGKSSNKNIKAKIIKRNFWQKLINKYWQETIFISSSNSILDKYTNKLKSTGLSVYEGNDYKNFLLQFSKDLLDRKIHFNTDIINNNKISELGDKNNVYIKYQWLKFYNPNSLLIRYNIYKPFPDHYINSSNSSLPLFILINNNKQIILSESSDELSNRTILLKFYNKFTTRGLNNKKLYTGLFFVNPEDAIEYQNYITNKYKKSTRNLQVKLVATTLDFYKKMLYKSNQITEFRLIPDLQEVANLLFKYRRNKNLDFDINQKYGYNYFQGQPIYMIKPVRVRKYENEIKYFYSYYDRNNQKIEYNPIFLNHNTALGAWRTYFKSFDRYNLPVKPCLYVFNLEAFINTPHYIKNQDKFIFLPSLNTFNFIKICLQNNLKNSSDMWKIFIDKSLSLQSLCYRILWSLTTRQPNTW